MGSKSIVVFASLFVLAFASAAHAIYLPGQKPLPHTNCFEDGMADAGIQIYLTAVNGSNGNAELQRADIFESTIAGSNHIGARNVRQTVRMGANTYKGNEFLLVIATGTKDGRIYKTGRLNMVLGNGEKVVKTLRCEGLMHIMNERL